MKTLLYKATDILDFIPIKYEGYRSMFFSDHNNPHNDLEDFADYNCDAPDIPDNRPDNISKFIVNFYPIKLTYDSKYEDTFLLSKEAILYSGNNIILSCIFILNNIKKKGTACLRLENISCIIDLITIMANFFESCKIIKCNSRYILLEKYIGNKNIKDKAITFFKYYYESNKVIRALKKNDDEKLLIKFL